MKFSAVIPIKDYNIKFFEDLKNKIPEWFTLWKV